MSETKKYKVYCKRCGDLISEVELHSEPPKTLMDHIICTACYNKGVGLK